MPQINPNEPLDIEWRHGQLCWAGSNNPSVRIVNGVNGTEQQQQQQQHHNVQRLETIATRWESRAWAQEGGWGAVSFGFSSFCDFFFFTQKQVGRGRLVPRCPPLDPPLGTREEQLLESTSGILGIALLRLIYLTLFKHLHKMWWEPQNKYARTNDSWHVGFIPSY